MLKLLKKLNRIDRSQISLDCPDNEPWLKLVARFIGRVWKNFRPLA